MQFLTGDLFSDLPTLRFIIPHGGAAVPYHFGRYRGLADMLKKLDLRGHVMNNVFFDAGAWVTSSQPQRRRRRIIQTRPAIACMRAAKAVMNVASGRVTISS